MMGRPLPMTVPSGPGVLGAPGDAPFDQVLVSAKVDALPTALVDQLAVGGRLVVPVTGWMVLVTTGEWASAGAVETSEHGAYRFVPLVED